MTVPQDLASFALVAGLLTLVPGIDTSLVLRSALTRSKAYAWATSCSIFSGALIWGAAAAVGATALLGTSELAYRLLTIVGAAYMIWLGASMIWKTFRPRGSGTTEALEIAPPTGSLWKAWLTGVGTNLLNPKAGAFYVATIPQFIPAGTSPRGMGLVLALIHGLLCLIWFALLIAASTVFSKHLQRAWTRKVIDRITGGVLVGFGAKLALSPR